MDAQGASQIAKAPIVAMPGTMQESLLWVTGLLALAVFAWSLSLARRDRSPVPPLLVIGAFCSILLEALVGYLGHVTHPPIGNVGLYAALDRVIPWHIAFGYTVGFGIVFLVIYRNVMAGTASVGLFYRTGAITAVCYYFGETVGVSTGTWVYFEPSPLWVWKATAPVTWSFMNTAAELFSVALVMFLLPRLSATGRLAIPALSTMGTIMGHFGANFVLMNAINSSLPRAAMEAAGVVTLVLSVAIWWIAAQLAVSAQADLHPKRSVA